MATISRERQERAYAELMGAEAFARQKALAEGTCPECFKPNGTMHHLHCPRRPGEVGGPREDYSPS